MLQQSKVQGHGGKSFWIPPRPCFCNGTGEAWLRKCTVPLLDLLLEQGVPPAQPPCFSTYLHMGLENTTGI